VSFNTWMPAALLSEDRPWAVSVWRMVEAQHTASLNYRLRLEAGLHDSPVSGGPVHRPSEAVHGIRQRAHCRLSNFQTAAVQRKSHCQ
jgi:hypothetical protein